MIAVLIKGNPKFIHNDVARSYYNEIEDFLKSLGFKVEVNAGADYTRPRQDAALYIGHSRGAGRYEFMDSKNKKKFLRFGDPDGVIDPVDRKWQAENPPPTNAHPPKEHFTFSEAEKKAITDKVEELGLTISTESKMSEYEMDTKERLLAMAMNDTYLGPDGLKVGVEGMELIVLPNGEAAGFIMPMNGTGSYKRVGSIYIDPKYRGKNIARDYVTQYFKDKAGQAWIRHDNKPSQGTFKAAGFYRTGRRVTVKGHPYDEWINRPQTLAW